MAVAESDTRLLQGMENAEERIGGLDLNGPAATIRDQAVSLLKKEGRAFKKVVDEEDREEVEAMEARIALGKHREQANEAFSRLYLGLHAGVIQRKLAGEADPELNNLTHYLDGASPSSFAAGSLASGIANLERARAFADRYVPDDLRPGINAFVDRALRAVTAASAELNKEEGEAAQALTRLEAARQAARDAYLTARDLMSASLRMAGEHQRLSAVVPGLADVLGGSTRGRSEDVTPEAAAAGSD